MINTQTVPAVIPVVIAGGGPNGLMLAAELQLAGIATVILERLPEPNQAPKANGLVGQIVELLDHRGLYQTITNDPDAPKPAPAFIFGGLPLPVADLPDNPMRILPIQQRDLERVLETHATSLGAELRRGHEVTDLHQDADTVTIQVTAPTGPYQLRARYLIGCDGAHSTVRKLAGIAFPGVTSTDIVSRSAHVIIDPAVLHTAPGGPTGTMHILDLPGVGQLPAFGYHRTATGAFVHASFTPGVHLVTTLEWDGATVDDEAPMTIDELRASARRVLGVDLPISAPDQPGHHVLRRLVGRNTRIAERYRAGRVLVAGDAAHVHTAIGGPGLNLGLADVVNLGWKLAAHLNGAAPDTLLDTYHAERHPVGMRVVLHTQAQQALLAPGSDITALRELFGELLHQPGNRQHIANLMSGAETRYPADPDAHPLTGRFAPNLDLTINDQPHRLAHLMHAARPVLLQLDPTLDLTDRAAGWRDRVDHITATCANPPAAALLIRPDGHVAWATTNTTANATNTADGLTEALTTWFGPVNHPVRYPA